MQLKQSYTRPLKTEVHKHQRYNSHTQIVCIMDPTRHDIIDKM